MKLIPVNGINVCKLVFVSEMDVFSTCFNFLTIFQAGGQVTNTNVSSSENAEVICGINVMLYVLHKN